MRYVDLSNKSHVRSSADLPDGFSYPPSFLEYVLLHDGFPADLSPWTIEPTWADVEERIRKHRGAPVVIFAFAQLEDIVACFLVDGISNDRVLVVNPFLHREENGVWHQDKCVTLAELENFLAWLAWTRDNGFVPLDQLEAK